MDPALWAVLDGPADDVVAALIRLAPGAAPPDRVRVVARFGDVATIRVRRGELLRVRNDPAIESCKAPLLLVPEPAALDVDRLRARARGRRRALGGAGAPTGRGAVVGVIDWGCDFTHPNLLRASGRTRLLALWDQRPAGAHPPAPYGYGVVHRAAAIDRALEAPDPFAALGYDLAEADADGNGTHGMHVIDIAAGVPRVGPGGVAPGTYLAFVNMATPAWGPRSVGSSVTLLEAVDFIARTAGARPWVINLSLGSQGGPHDGKTLAEQALDTVVQSGPGRIVVQSCGNYGRRPIHTAGRLGAGERVAIDWLIDPTDETENEIEIWYPGTDSLVVHLVAPDGRIVVRAPPDSHGPIVIGGVTVGRFGHRTRDPNNGDAQAAFFLDPQDGGRWRVVLEALSVARGGGGRNNYHAWVERDDIQPGSQSHLTRAQAVSATTTGTICNGHHTIVVGAYDPATRAPAWFSSKGPTRDGRAKPDIYAPGVGIVAARSAPDQDDYRGDPYLTSKSGTSMASPHVAGAVAVLYEAAGRPLTADEVKRILVDTARPMDGGRDRAGPGLLDLRAAVARVIARSTGTDDIGADGFVPTIADGVAEALLDEGVVQTGVAPIQHPTWSFAFFFTGRDAFGRAARAYVGAYYPKSPQVRRRQLRADVRHPGQAGRPVREGRWRRARPRRRDHPGLPRQRGRRHEDRAHRRRSEASFHPLGRGGPAEGMSIQAPRQVPEKPRPGAVGDRQGHEDCRARLRARQVARRLEGAAHHVRRAAIRARPESLSGLLHRADRGAAARDRRSGARPVGQDGLCRRLAESTAQEKASYIRDEFRDLVPAEFFLLTRADHDAFDRMSPRIKSSDPRGSGLRSGPPSRPGSTYPRRSGTIRAGRPLSPRVRGTWSSTSCPRTTSSPGRRLSPTPIDPRTAPRSCGCSKRGRARV